MDVELTISSNWQLPQILATLQLPHLCYLAFS